jgi:hypothetical protein
MPSRWWILTDVGSAKNRTMHRERSSVRKDVLDFVKMFRTLWPGRPWSLEATKQQPIGSNQWSRMPGLHKTAMVTHCRLGADDRAPSREPI